MRAPVYALLCALVLTTAACSGAAPAATPATAVPTGKRVDPATAGSISGNVTFKGATPAPVWLPVNSDQACLQVLGTRVKSDALLVGPNGGVANAFVYIKSAFTDYVFETPTRPVTLDQRGCHYTPRVFGVMVGQSIDILNSDPTLHNVHAQPTVNGEFNKGQPVQGSHMTQVFTAPEVMVHLKCDVHPWMSSFVGVVAHPFFAVSAADGSFTIPGVPPGEYELTVWHETLGTQSVPVTITDRGTATAHFTLATK